MTSSSSSLPSAPAVPPARIAPPGAWSAPVLLGLVRSEARKTLTTSAWWALLIPAGLLGGLVTLAMAAAGGLAFSPALAQASAMDSFSAKFAVLFGAVCATAEYRHRTITSTYLSSAGRAQVVLAKAVVAAVVGAVYGVAAALCGLLGMLIGGGNLSGLETGSLFIVSGVAVLLFALWAVLGVGVGMLVSNQLGTIVLVLVYLLLVERIIVVLVAISELGHIDDYLPAGSASGALNQLAGEGLLGGSLSGGTRYGGAFPWWADLLVFVGYAVVAVLGGAVVAQRRDVT